MKIRGAETEIKDQYFIKFDVLRFDSLLRIKSPIEKSVHLLITQEIVLTR